MSTASEQAILPAFAPAEQARRTHASRRWERILIVLGVCLPVPVLAATGLSIPLPATVERIAAALVPWAQEANLDPNQTLARGSIVLAPGEESVGGSEERITVRPSRGSAEPRSHAGRSLPADEGGGGSEAAGSTRTTTKKKTAGQSQAGQSQEPVSAEPTPTDPGTTEPGTEPKPDPGGQPSPVQDTVNQVEKTTQPVVDEVQATVDGVAGTGGAGATVDGIVSGLGQ
jgi:hypothetical protein